MAAFPEIDELKKVGVWWFSRTPEWTRRHVETLEIESHRDARRQLTIEVELPRDPEASFLLSGGRRLFFVPIALVAKPPRKSHFALSDERGETVDQFTRPDNAEISAAALKGARVLLAPEISKKDAAILEPALDGLTWAVGRKAQTYAALADEILRNGAADYGRTPELRNLVELIEDLSANSMLWVPLAGVPGQSRSVKLDYHIPLNTPPVLRRPRRAHRIKVAVESNIGAFRVLERRPPDTYTRGTPRRIWNRFARTVGFSPYELNIETPYLRRTYSYHLDVKSPPGLEARRVVLRDPAKVLDKNGTPVRIDKSTTARRAYLYFAGAEKVDPGPVMIQFRVEWGTIFVSSAMISTLAAVMLWLFAADARTAVNHDAVAGPTLLVVPALLIIFAFRPGEHALTAHLLSGVRLLTLLFGVCAVAGAAALAGVLPFGTVHGAPWRSVGRNWRDEAVVATVVSVVLTIGCLLALTGMDRVREAARVFCGDRKRYALLAWGLFIGEFLVVGFVGAGNYHGVRQWALGGLMAVGALFTAWIAAYGEETDRPGIAALLALSAPAVLLSAVVYVGYSAGNVRWSELRRLDVIWFAALFLGGVVVSAIGWLRGLLRARRESRGRWKVDVERPQAEADSGPRARTPASPADNRGSLMDDGR